MNVTSKSRNFRLLIAACLSALLTGSFLLGVAGPTAANMVGTGTHPWVVILCKSSNEPNDPGGAGSLAFYRQMYTDAGAGSGQYNFVDWWRDASFGQLSVSGTIVADGAHADANGWYTMPETRDTWGYSRDRYGKVVDCANAAVQDVNFNNYYGVIAIFPEAGGAATTTAISATSSTLTLNMSNTSPTPGITTTNYFPTAPFLMNLDDCNGGSPETVDVTAVSGNQFTIARGANGSSATSHAAGSCANVPGDFGEVTGTPVGTDPDGQGTGQSVVSLSDGNHNLSLVVLPNETNIAGVQHESGHGLGYDHSRALSTSTVDYNDSTDIMSVYSDTYEDNSLGTTFGGSVLGSGPNDKGPGLTAINLDSQGWIPAARHELFNNATPNQSTITLHALGDPNALTGTGYLEARVPAAIQIENTSPANVAPTSPPTCSGAGFACTTSQYYTVEYRQQAGWDSGFPANSVVVHLYGSDARAYWIDQTPNGHNGLLYAGDEYVDAAHSTYIAVNSTTGATSQVTLGSVKINAQLAYSGATSGNYGHTVTLAGDLTVGGAPVPNQPVSLSVGTQSCSATTSLTGHAQCSVILTQAPGTYSAGGSFAGDAAYNAVSGSATFTILKAPSITTVSSSANPSVFGQPVTLTATVTPTAGGSGTPTGTVTILDGSTPIGSGALTGSSYSVTVSTFAVATHHITATYSGDSNFTVSTSANVDQVVTKAMTTTTVTASPSGSAGFGHPVTFTATVGVVAPGAGSPTGPVVFSIDGTAVGSVPLSSTETASVATSALSPGNHTVTAAYQGDGNFLGSSGTITYLVTCTHTITGSVNGAVIAGGDSTCIVNAQINGAIVVSRGTSLAVENSTVTGAITANGPDAFQLCGSSTGGAVTVSGATGLVIIGDPGDAACAPNTIGGALNARNDTHGVEIIGNTIRGPLVTSNDSGPGPFPGDVTTISGNTTL